MNPGKVFEQSFRDSIGKDSYYLRINDPAQSFSNPESLRFSPKNPFDCLIFRSPYLYTFELKSTIGALSFFTSDSPTRSVNIKRCQIEGLTSSAKFPNVVSGFILNFRDKAHTYFLPIKSFTEFATSTKKKSINENDVISLNAYLIPQTLKRTKYHFDIDSFLKNASKGG